ncbi:MAG: hypothetical protein ACKN9W_17825 [Methylococcus sp.]
MSTHTNFKKSLVLTAIVGLLGTGGLASASESAELRALRAEIARLRAENRAEIQGLKQELALSQSQGRADSKVVSDKLEAQEQKLEQQVKANTVEEQAHRNLVFFRSGYAALSNAREGELFINNVFIADTNPHQGNGNGWYIGGGFDFNITPDIWGHLEGIQLDAELMFEYKDYGTTQNELVNFLTQKSLTIENQVSGFTLTASPKIKFTQLGDFRPWIIPVGLGIHVISPPSSGVTYLDPGLMVGVGSEYRIWEQIYAGVDFRYHFTGGALNYKSTPNTVNGATILNSTDLNGLTAGAYLGFGF